MMREQLVDRRALLGRELRLVLDGDRRQVAATAVSTAARDGRRGRQPAPRHDVDGRVHRLHAAAPPARRAAHQVAADELARLDRSPPTGSSAGPAGSSSVDLVADAQPSAARDRRSPTEPRRRRPAPDDRRAARPRGSSSAASNADTNSARRRRPRRQPNRSGPRPRPRRPGDLLADRLARTAAGSRWTPRSRPRGRSRPTRRRWPSPTAPRTAIVVTSASPIISADAVAAVRRGLRRAFSLASRPTVPNSAGTPPAIAGDDRPADHRAEQRDAERTPRGRRRRRRSPPSEASARRPSARRRPTVSAAAADQPPAHRRLRDARRRRACAATGAIRAAPAGRQVRGQPA